MTKRSVVPLLLFCLSAFSCLAASQEASPQGLPVGPNVMASQIITKVPPIYPPLARQARIQGTVVLRVRINKTGDVENLQLVSGHPMLAPAAIEAVKQWKYKPYLLNGDAVEVATTVTVNFTLSGKSPAEGAVSDAPGAVTSSNPENAPPPAVPQRIRVSQGVMQGLLVSKVQPEYPPDAKDQRVQGAVVLKVSIDKEGNVANVQLVNGHPLLAPAAIEAVKQWKYKPFLLDGVPLEVETQVTVNFTLEE
ncbi:MAG: energy transducer TonB [Candidatus Sulfotelmatobacter sp.]